MLQLVLTGLEQPEQDAIERLCRGDWDRVVRLRGDVLRVMKLDGGFHAKRFPLSFEEPSSEAAEWTQSEITPSTPAETARSEHEIAEDLREVRLQYIAAVKASCQDPDALWVECVETSFHEPHWWEFSDKGRRPEWVGCTGAGWVS